MITEQERARWRQLFTKATTGPWSVQLHPFTKTIAVSAAAGFDPIVGERVNVKLEDADLIAEARLGWPRTLEELGEVERRLLRADIEHEKACQEMAAEHQERERALAFRLKVYEARIEELTKKAAEAAALKIEVERLELKAARASVVARAALRWQRDRFSPALLAAVDAYKELSGG